MENHEPIHRWRRNMRRSIVILILGLTPFVPIGCAGTQQAVTEPGPEGVEDTTPGSVVPGMSRQDVIAILGPPMLVTQKAGLDTEYLIYPPPSGSSDQEPNIDSRLVIAVDKGKVSATGSVSDFGLD